MVKSKKSFIMQVVFFMWLLLISTNVLANYEKVYDDANLLSEQERAEINEKALALSDQTQMDIVIVTTDDSQDKASSQYALDYYEEHGFGYQGTLDGVLYLINMDEREVYIFTRDKGTNYIDASRVDELLDLVYPSLADGKYSESVHLFLDEVEKIMAAGAPANSINDSSGDSGYDNTEEGNGSSSIELSMFDKIGIYLLISLAIGGIVVGIMAMGNKGRSTVTASTYLQGDSFVITKKRDQHYNTIVTQQKIQNNNNNNSGGSFSGGSGGGIGGGGRKF
ncbi:TPM domain-containing protein [Bacillus marasmi]|uniref:TPM domain-containing protein n=1 Tax=Bacillus marasmi TaxID=1926279 RepID=UPI0011CB504D|nr:TPM domain-containing protein [Bacillus marasmi]